MLIATVFSALLLQTFTSGQEVDSNVLSLTEENTNFAVNLYKQVAEGSNNLFLSPYSISAALAMTYMGASGTTRDEMNEVCGFGNVGATPEEFASTFASLSGILFNENNGYTLQEANRLFGDDDYKFLQPFMDTLENNFNAPLEQVDFGNTEETRMYINDWVAENTNQKILDLLGPDSIDASTLLVLVNAIYFNALWETQFNAANTAEGTFYVNPKREVQVPMMQVTANFSVSRDNPLNCDVVKIPYAGRNVAMYIIMPPSGMNALSEMEENLTGDTLRETLDSLPEEINMRLFMPKFQITHQQSVKEALQGLGMNLLFSRAADLSGMDGTNRLFAGDAIHQAFVDVHEEGTEAAAATAVTITYKSARPSININRPFLFVIQEESTGTVLFMGRVENPTRTVMTRRSALQGGPNGDGGDGSGGDNGHTGGVTQTTYCALTGLLAIISHLIFHL